MYIFLPAQSFRAALPLDAVVIPCGQGMHEDEPNFAWYVPTGHSSHGDDASFKPFDEKVPGLHCAET